QKRLRSAGGHHFGSLVVSVAEDVPVRASATFDIREMKVHDALKYIEQVTDPAERARLLEQEKQHPKYLGGRSMVRAALEDEPAVPVAAMPYAISDDGED